MWIRRLRISKKRQSCISPSKFAGRSVKEPGGSILLLFLAPSLLGVMVFVMVPFADVLRRSFYNSMATQFVGLGNYLGVLRNDAFRLAAGNTLKFAAVCIPALVLASLLLAVFLSGAGALGERCKSAFLLPYAIPAASVVLIWKLLFHDAGLMNRLLVAVGLSPVSFMDSGAAFWVLVLSYLWKNMGYDMVLWMAGLSGIPKDLYEAASIDGAGAVKQFFYVTLPNLVPVLFTISVLSLLNSFKVFREAYLVAGEHPHTSMYLLQHLFNNWFTELDVEKLCAGAVLMALVVMGLVVLLAKAWGELDEES